MLKTLTFWLHCGQYASVHLRAGESQKKLSQLKGYGQPKLLPLPKQECIFTDTRAIPLQTLATTCILARQAGALSLTSRAHLGDVPLRHTGSKGVRNAFVQQCLQIIVDLYSFWLLTPLPGELTKACKFMKANNTQSPNIQLLTSLS
jgi:hypothetical protein